jgi:hypothetical protein
MKHFALKMASIMFILGSLGGRAAVEPFIGFTQFFVFLIALFVILVRLIKPVS